jgi:hypothetical protein
MRRTPPQQLQLQVEALEPQQEVKRDRPHADGEAGQGVERPAAARRRTHRAAKELLDTPSALLTRSHLRELGLERRAVDAVFRSLPVVALPGYSRPLIRAEDYLELLQDHTYHDDRVRPTWAA